MFVYKELESVEEYILIEQNRVYAEIYRRRRDNELWDWNEFETGEEVEFASIDFKMSVAEIFRGVAIPEIDNLGKGLN